MSDWSAGDASAMARIRPEEFSCCGRKQGLLRALQYLKRQCARDRRKALEKLFQRVVALQIFKQSLNGYARPLEHRSAAKDIGINRDEIRAAHIRSLLQITYAVVPESLKMKTNRRLHVGERFFVTITFAHNDAFEAERISDVPIRVPFDNDLLGFHG